MASYLDVKRIFCRVMSAKNMDSLDENSDVDIPITLKNMDGISINYSTIPNDIIRSAFETFKNQVCDEVQLYSDNNYEAAISSKRGLRQIEKVINDTDNDISYRLGNASLEYIMMICNQMCEKPALFQDYLYSLLLFKTLPYRNVVGVKEHIARVFHIKTITVLSEEKRDLDFFKNCCSSFEFLYMYKTRESIMRIHSICDLFNLRGGGRARCDEISEPPRRTVNSETLEFYAMGVDSDDPFTAYISFYHVLEYYFDAVYRKKMISEMKKRITSPDFSYKDENELYRLAKWVGKKMRNFDENGRGNELDSLKYVLEEYVSIQKLVEALDKWNSAYKDYYSKQNVSFTGASNGKIAWTDTQGVYTNLANRIYSTRNALVHSKSEHSENQYKPLKNKMELEKELPLIQIIAELIVIENGEVL